MECGWVVQRLPGARRAGTRRRSVMICEPCGSQALRVWGVVTDECRRRSSCSTCTGHGVGVGCAGGGTGVAGDSGGVVARAADRAVGVAAGEGAVAVGSAIPGMCAGSSPLALVAVGEELVSDL